MLFVKNSKRGTKFIISYWTVEETENDGEDEVITLVTDALCVLFGFMYLYILQFWCIQNVPQCLSDH